MNETRHDCRLGNADCALHCHPQSAVRFPDALARFGREAVRGTLDTGRYRMPYFSWGEGPPLLFIHGVSDSSRSFLLPIALLSAYFRCIAYDLPAGRGDGARLRRYTHPDLVADLWALLDHLGVRQSYILASSFGATIALAALGERPERLPRAVLQGAFARRPLRRAEWLLARVTRHLPGSMARVPFRNRILRAINHDTFAGLPPEVWENFLESSGQAAIASFAYQALMLHRLDLRPLLPHVRQPVLLVHGEHDTVVPWAHAEELLRGLPNARCAVLEGCGHVPSYTHPEMLAEVVRQALTPPACPHG
jgi:pimeloyl-ACP methyl ester carboxylesterase